MQLSYDGIVFDLVLLENWHREAVFDPTGIDFLYHHHIIDVIVTVGGARNDRRYFPAMQRNFAGELDIGKVPAKNFFAGKRIGTFPHISPNINRGYPQKGLAQRQQGILDAVDLNADTDDGTRNDMFNKNGKPTFPWEDNDIILRLKTPRRQLLIWMYSGVDEGERLDGGNVEGVAEFLLSSPYTGVGVDALHGPVCTILDLPKIHGNSSGIHRLRFETWVAPLDPVNVTTNKIKSDISRLPFEVAKRLVGAQQELFDDDESTVLLDNVKDDKFAKKKLANIPAMISNRWSMRSEPDPETYLNVSIIEGTAIFRMDVLKTIGVTPDQLRRQFMHPIPLGYQRLAPKVSLSPLGNAVQYMIVDKEVVSNFHAGAKYGMASIDVKQEMQFHNPLELS